MTRSALALVLAFLLAACGGTPTATDPMTSTTPTASPTPTTPTTTSTPSPTPSEPADGTGITARTSDFGTILFDARGQAIYIWEVEKTSEAECYDGCAELWPPVLTTGEPVAGDGVRGALLGTTRRTDGTVQVTYNGHPLYFYAHEGPGEVECHNIATHGGLWWAVTTAGDRAP